MTNKMTKRARRGQHKLKNNNVKVTEKAVRTPHDSDLVFVCKSSWEVLDGISVIGRDFCDSLFPLVFFVFLPVFKVKAQGYMTASRPKRNHEM